ncbi:hypothetical protein [Nonomuraea cavernae]|uniref:Uncharacterized protein n=1 Tax=Nonomuraea cavernae TaxID=2045107 RepID=A0A918DL86_9ACTN|nr:hypothetical protein [Nonomuraea cavernae]MCA2186465.1 hypothetical protein [Nonomuraea cavernae]GGO71167.1 hypothetical protein GCM10012289_36260 [Nonomuraea cavernae]
MPFRGDGRAGHWFGRARVRQLVLMALRCNRMTAMTGASAARMCCAQSRCARTRSRIASAPAAEMTLTSYGARVAASRVRVAVAQRQAVLLLPSPR